MRTDLKINFFSNFFDNLQICTVGRYSVLQKDSTFLSFISHNCAKRQAASAKNLLLSLDHHSHSISFIWPFNSILSVYLFNLPNCLFLYIVYCLSLLYIFLHLFSSLCLHIVSVFIQSSFLSSFLLTSAVCMFGYFTQYYNYHYYSNCNYYVNSQIIQAIIITFQ